MRTCPSLLETALAREDLTICKLWEITLTNGVTYYYTDLSSPVVMNGHTYISYPGIDISAIRNSVNGGFQNAQINLGYSDEAITEPMARFGDVDSATFAVFVVDYEHLDYGRMEIFAGRVISVALTERITCTLNVEGKSANNVGRLAGEIYSERCRNVFGDFRCKMDLEALSQEFSVLQVVDSVTFRTRPLDYDETADDTEGGLFVHDYTTPGTFSFTVPQCDMITYEIASAGGGGFIPVRGGPMFVMVNGRPELQDTGPYNLGATRTPAAAGGSSAFGPLTVPGGVAGNLNIKLKQKDASETYNTTPYSILYQPDDYPVDPLTSLPTSGETKPSELFPGGGGAGGEGGYGYGGAYKGGDGTPGGLVKGSFLVGDTHTIKVGDVLTVVVGAGGAAGGYFDDPQEVGQPGSPGYVKFTVSVQPTEGYDGEYNLGSIVWTDGNNKGQVDSIASNAAGIIKLALEPNRPMLPGDRGKFRPGCSNYADMCENRWDNLINMRAEPVAPQGAGTNAPTPEVKPKEDPTKPPPAQQPYAAAPTSGALPMRSGNSAPGGSYTSVGA